jgi:hypothetical protein
VRRIVLLCIGASVLGLGGSPPAPTNVSFLAVGDFGVGGRTEASLGLRMERHATLNAADLLVLLGDNDYTRSPTRFRTNWRRSFGWARESGLSVAGVLGNHDVEVAGGRYELAPLGMPRRYYTRRLGDVELFLLDSNSVSAAQTAWLRARLSSSTAAWKIAVFHHPPYSCGGHGGDSRVKARWVPLFERYGVQLVLTGHDHNYQRFATRNGVTYVVHGGGGASLYRLRRCSSAYPRRVRALYEHGFVEVTVADDQLELRAVDLRGRVRDRLTLTGDG